MKKTVHEIRDPIHVFVRLEPDERRVVDSEAFQRLRHIHQLATTFLVYPGATHRRFEHSLGVMELASRVFDVVTELRNVPESARDILEEINQPAARDYWRRVLRMAALLHDVGHLPFSHAAESELLPAGWDHERISRELILSEELRGLLGRMKPPPDPMDVVKLALGPRKAPDLVFTPWETILAEIIVGDAFGVDRMDYLLRDSHHAGVAYGKFDHFRLIDTLRILEPDEAEGFAPALGVERGGLNSAEALMLARYFMFSQLYYHPVRRIYDIHLKDFLSAWLPGGRFSTHIPDHLAMNDNEVLVAVSKAARDPGAPGHDPARRIVRREHFVMLYARNHADLELNPDACRVVYEAAAKEFGDGLLRLDRIPAKGAAPSFRVRMPDSRLANAIEESDVLRTLPSAAAEYVFVDRALRDDANRWLKENREALLRMKGEENHG